MHENKLQLYFREMAHIVDAQNLSAVVMADSENLRALSVICDEAMTQQLMLRHRRLPTQQVLLPEVLTRMMFQMGNAQPTDFEMFVYGIHNGQYKTILTYIPDDLSLPLRISDAILLNIISNIPLFIDRELFLRQSYTYEPVSTGLTIPINTIDTDRLNKELQKAIESENYRLASALHEEIKKRSGE